MKLKNFSLQYSPNITEGIFNKIIEFIEENGYKKYMHCGLNTTYESFKEYHKHLNISVNKYTDCGRKKVWCVDNNSQGLTLITLKDIEQIKQKDNLNFNKYHKFPNHKNTPNMFSEEDEVVVTRKVHGTNARFGIVKKNKLSLWDKVKRLFGYEVEYEFILGSHNVIKTYSKDGGFYNDNVWAECAIKYGIEEKLWDLFYKIRETEPDLLGTGIILYGEIYGEGIQGQHYTYGLKGRQLGLFDIELNKQYLNREEFNEFVFELDLPLVETLYRGPYNLEIINKLIEKNYIPGTKTPHEGVVVSHVSGDRTKISKMINPEYLMFGEKNEVPDSH